MALLAPGVSGKEMDAELRRVLNTAYPGEEARYFRPMSIGGAPEHADEGAALILSGVKTLTSSPFWDYPDGKIPFVGALSVLLDGARRPRGIVETTRVEIMPFKANPTLRRKLWEWVWHPIGNRCRGTVVFGIGDIAGEPRMAEEGRPGQAQRNKFRHEYTANEQTVVAQFGRGHIECNGRYPHARTPTEQKVTQLHWVS